MNELQLALLAAGVVAVLAVWIYNALQERKHRKLAEAIFKGGQDDVLLRNARTEEPAVATPVTGDMSMRREPVLDADEHHDDLSTLAPEAPFAEDDTAAVLDRSNELVQESPAKAARPSDDLLPWADPLADCLIGFELDSPVLASGLFAAQGNLRGEVTKPVRWLARHDASSPWTAVDSLSSERYAHWMVSLQLVDRRGAVSDAELGRFFDSIQQIGMHLGKQITVPGRSEMLMRAEELDRFCASVDVQFALSVVNAQGATFAGTKLRGVCQAAGLVLEDDGLYHYRNAAGESEFALGNAGNEPFDQAGMSSLATHGVSLFIDVPRVSDGTASFNRMVLVARQLAQGLGGTLVDANRAPLAEQMIATIRNKIGEFQLVLAKAGIDAGSPRALRLFS
jgi:hypothetical protein